MNSDTIVHKVIVTSGNGLTKTYEITITRLTNNNQNNNTTNNNNQSISASISNIISASSYVANNEFLSNISFGSGVSTLIDNLKKYSATVSITVKDKDNNSKTSGTIVTGDKVIISTGSEEKTFTVVLYGDTNGDGSISAIDLLNIQKIIINKSNLNGAFYKAADTNKDGKISAIDLLNVQKHILGKLIISQN